jgi:hypothetical protein
MRTFDEHSGRARLIMDWFEMVVGKGSAWHNFELKEPLHDISRRFLNEIEEFKPSKEVE